MKVRLIKSEKPGSYPIYMILVKRWYHLSWHSIYWSTEYELVEKRYRKLMTIPPKPEITVLQEGKAV